MKSCCLASLVVAALAIGLHAQQVQLSMPATYLGTSVGRTLHFDRLTNRTTDTITLKFGPPDTPAFTVDYAFTYPGTTITRPSIVDQTLTRFLPDEVQPAFEFNVGSEWTPLHARQTSRSAATHSMPVSNFEHFAGALRVRLRIYGSELVCTEAQMHMLRQQTVDRWK